jgi:hypothetical protein
VVAYESEKEGNGDVREYDQAKNLYERVFKDDPQARLVVNAGYAHIQENGKYLGGKSMAQHFTRVSGIDPLTVEQTMLIEHPPGTENHPYYQTAMQSLHPKSPIVFLDAAGKPWTLKPKAYDVSVFFPPDDIRDGRPSWLDLGGLRTAYSFGGAACQDTFPCLIEARYAKEGDDAIPADRLVLDPTGNVENTQDRVIQRHPLTKGMLYLRPGSYRITGHDVNGHTLFRQDMTMDAAGRPATAAQ